MVPVLSCSTLLPSPSWKSWAIFNVVSVYNWIQSQNKLVMAGHKPDTSHTTPSPSSLSHSTITIPDEVHNPPPYPLRPPSSLSSASFNQAIIMKSALAWKPSKLSDILIYGDLIDQGQLTCLLSLYRLEGPVSLAPEQGSDLARKVDRSQISLTYIHFVTESSVTAREDIGKRVCGTLQHLRLRASCGGSQTVILSFPLRISVHSSPKICPVKDLPDHFLLPP